MCHNSLNFPVRLTAAVCTCAELRLAPFPGLQIGADGAPVENLDGFCGICRLGRLLNPRFRSVIEFRLDVWPGRVGLKKVGCLSPSSPTPELMEAQLRSARRERSVPPLFRLPRLRVARPCQPL